MTLTQHPLGRLEDIESCAFLRTNAFHSSEHTRAFPSVYQLVNSKPYMLKSRQPVGNGND